MIVFERVEDFEKRFSLFPSTMKRLYPEIKTYYDSTYAFAFALTNKFPLTTTVETFKIKTKNKIE